MLWNRSSSLLSEAPLLLIGKGALAAGLELCRHTSGTNPVFLPVCPYSCPTSPLPLSGSNLPGDYCCSSTLAGKSLLNFPWGISPRSLSTNIQVQIRDSWRITEGGSSNFLLYKKMKPFHTSGAVVSLSVFWAHVVFLLRWLRGGAIKDGFVWKTHSIFSCPTQ